MTDPTLVYVAGPGHSGSTLLDQLLATHPYVATLGEVHRLSLAAQVDHRAFRCSCTRSIHECDYWTATLAALGATDPRQFLEDFPTTVADAPIVDEAQDYLGLHRSTPRTPINLDRITSTIGNRSLRDFACVFSRPVRAADAAADNSQRLFAAVRQVHQTPIVVDSSKNPGRMKSLWMRRDPEVKFRVLQIRRDGRAVCASRIRREQTTMRRAAAVWVAEHRRLQVARLVMRNVDEYLLTYEELTDEPTNALDRIMSWLGLDNLTSITEFGSADRHNLSGNPVRFDASRMQKVVPDERWRDELSLQQLREFDDIAGKLNRRFGYE